MGPVLAITCPFLAAFPTLSHSPAPLPASWGHLSNRLAFEPWSQDLLTGKYNLRYPHSCIKLGYRTPEGVWLNQ